MNRILLYVFPIMIFGVALYFFTSKEEPGALRQDDLKAKVENLEHQNRKQNAAIDEILTYLVDSTASETTKAKLYLFLEGAEAK